MARNETEGLKRTKLSDRSGFEALTIKAVIFALIGVVLAVLQAQLANIGLISGALGTGSVLSVSALAVVFLAIILNTVMNRAFFKRKELSIIYIGVAVGACAGTWGVASYAIYSMIGLQSMHLRFGMNFGELFEYFNHLAFPDMDAVTNVLLGGVPMSLKPWIGPLIFWFFLFAALYVALLSMGNLVRYRWTEVDRLTYPITKPVTSIIETDDKGSFGRLWYDPVMYIGFIVPLFFTGLQILNRYFPVVPTIPLPLEVHKYLPEGPMRTGWLNNWGPGFDIQPQVVALSYFAPLDLLFSFWISFILLNRGTSIVFEVAGLPNQFYQNFMSYQVTGGFVGFAISLLWLARRDIADIVNMAIGKRPANVPSDMQNTGMSPRACILGILISSVYIWFFLSYFANVNLLVAILWWLIFLLMAVSGARIRAESGVPIFNAVPLQPPIERIFKTVVGSAAFNPARIGGMGTVFGLIEITGMLPQSLEMYKIGDATNLKRSHVTYLMLGCFTVGFWAGSIILLSYLHKYGAFNIKSAALHLGEGFNSSYRFQTDPVPWAVPALVGGFAITWILMLLRTTYVWWPLHPAGYVLAWHQQVFHHYWGSIFVAWLIKFLVVRYGGRNGGRIAERFMLGVIVGSVVIGILGVLIQGIFPPG